VFPNRERAWFLMAAAVLIVLSHAVDIMLAGHLHWSAFALRLAWGLLLAATALAVRSGAERAVRVMAVLSAFGSVALFLALVQVTGRSQAQVLSFTYVLAMTLPLAMPEILGAAIAASGLLLMGAWTLLWLDGSRAAELTGWIHVGVMALGIAWLLSLALRRARLAEATAASVREVLQARLVEAERREAATERLSAMGRLAAQVAHEVNNPLAAARSTALYLRERLAGDLEAGDAGRDLVDALDRIAESVRQIQQPPTSPGDDR
jgi:signal transduction histidine kinase